MVLLKTVSLFFAPAHWEVESLTKYGKPVAHEAKVETAGKKSEIQVGPDGKPLDHEE